MPERHRDHDRRWGALIAVLAALAFGIAIGAILSAAASGSQPARPRPAVTRTRVVPGPAVTVTQNWVPLPDDGKG